MPDQEHQQIISLTERISGLEKRLHKAQTTANSALGLAAGTFAIAIFLILSS